MLLESYLEFFDTTNVEKFSENINFFSKYLWNRYLQLKSHVEYQNKVSFCVDFYFF